MGRLVIGGFAELEDALVERVLELKRGRALAPVTVVVGSGAVRTRVGDLLVRRLGAVANVEIVTLGRLAADLVARWHGAAPPLLAGPARERLVRRLVAERRARGLAYFGPVSERPHFAQALAATFADLREALVPPDPGWATGATDGGRGAGRLGRAADLEELYAAYCAELDGRGLADSAELDLRAARVAAEGVVRDAVVYGIYDLNQAQEKLVAALLDAGADLLAPAPRGAGAGDAAAVLLARAAGLSEARLAPSPAATDADMLAAMWQGAPARSGAEAPERPAEAAAGVPAPLEPLALRGDGTLTVVSVADERGEGREAVRAVLAAAAAGAACWDCAVVVPHRDDVERFATALRAADVPVACRLPDRSEAGRVLRRVADCLAPAAGEAFARRAVVDLLSAAPLRHAAPGGDLKALWLDEARQSGVVSGLEPWVERVRRRRGGLERRVAELEARASAALEVDDEDEADARLEPVRLRLQAARSLEAAVVALARAVAGLPQRATWGAWADGLAAFAADLFAAPVAAAVGDLAGRLHALDILHEEVATGEMAAVMRELLAEDRAPVGRTGRDGVAVVTPLELRGLRFHTIVFTGLAEGGFPVRGRPDPIFGDAERRRLAEALGTRLPLAEQRDAEAMLLFAFACEAARERLVLLAPRGDAATGRPRLPSRLLLRLASLAADHPVGLDELLGGEPLRAVWRRVAGGPSYEDAAAVWVDARERDAAALLALAPRSRTSARAYLAALLRERGEAERRLAAWHAGRSPEPGAWDGLLGDEARAALAARHPFLAEVHPTRLERYVSCPFAFFLRDVLDLQAPEEPGDSLEIDAREFGTLAHDILQRAYQAVIAGDLDREAALAAVASAWKEACAAAEQRGVTGAAVAWEVRRAVLLEDLLESVRRDQVFSRDGERPVAVEWRFGQAAGRPVALDVPGGRRVRFAGRLDRIDAIGRGACVIDYKTGAGRTEDDRIKAGLSVQLPVYQLAVRQAGGEHYDRVASLYRLVTRRGGFKDLPLPGGEDAAAAQLLALVAEAMTLIDAGLFPRTSKDGCDYCELGYACGLSAWTRARKREHESLADVVALQTEGPDGGRTMPERPASDQDVRARVTGDLRTSFLVEAGAGTGKTRVLVERYVRCVLDPQLGAGDVRQVAAITFTEKAAGELRQRVREEFEALAAGASPGSAQAEAIARARDALDDAPIHTIHGFAGRLLREFPVEAGVDPAFEQLDALAGDLQRARLWDAWLAAFAAGDLPQPRVRDWLSRLLRAGVRLADVRGLAVGAKGVFGERYDLDPAPPPPAEPDLAGGLEGLREPTAQLLGFCGTACSDEEDKACCAATDLALACERLLAEPPAGLDALAARLLDLPVKGTAGALGGRQGNWDAVQGGKDELWLRYQRLTAAVAALRESHAAFVTGLAVAVADAFARWAGDVQLSLGQLDFTDLLGRLRDLLAGDLAARGALQSRFRYLLVDEFQDTDPLQAEIVFYLCEREPVAADWREVVLRPGKLFVVGDPKQSIYRFRRADIAMYDQVKELVGGQPGGTGAVEAISQNFRTTPALVEWVNRVFTDVFDADAVPGRQPRYQRVAAYRPAAEGPRVAVLLGATEYGGRGAGSAEAARRDEAAALAALLVAMRGPDAAQWRVQDRHVQGGGAAAGASAASAAAEAAEAASAEATIPGPAEGTRPPRWSDIAILMRTTTGLETYEQALRAAGVPYRVDGGKTYFARREVADALLCLRAVDDPSDGPALYGALHSSLFGFSDDDLFLFFDAGGRFDLFATEQPPGHEGIAGAMATLRRLHEARAASEPHELAAELLRVTNAVEFAAATGTGAPQAVANLEKLVERARAFAGAGGGGLAAFLDWAAEAGDAAGEQESQPDDEADVVRLLTVHKAKGLEYPIVILIGGALAGGWGGRETVRPIVDRGRRRLAVKLKAELPGAAARDLTPRAYVELNEREKEMEASELRRLFYVAATRARDRLVVTSFGKLTKQGGEAASGVLLGCAAGALPAPAPLEAAYEDGGVIVLPPGEAPAREERDEAPDAATMVAARGAWLAERAVLLAAATRPVAATSPSGLEHVDEELRAGGPGAPPARARALALGSAVHRVMELCDLDDESALPALAAAVTLELGWPDLAESAATLAAACWRAAPVRVAAHSAEVHREVSIGALVEGAILNGAIDLLYRDDGQWVVVDYKTDRGADAAVLRERYTPQGAAYAVAVEAATGEPVREVAFVAAAAGSDGEPLIVTVPVDDQLRGLARAEVEAAVAAGRAMRMDELGTDA